MIQLAVKGTVHNMRVVRRPHRSISKPLRNAPKGLAIDCILAAIIHVDFLIGMNLERAFHALQTRTHRHRSSYVPLEGGIKYTILLYLLLIENIHCRKDTRIPSAEDDIVNLLIDYFCAIFKIRFLKLVASRLI
jgi:hypothetical protein